MKLLEIITKTTTWFQERGIENARLETELLLAHILKMKRMELYLQFDRPMSEDELAQLRPLVARRGKREPLQHIIGDTEFRELVLKCDSRALIPRPDTEQIIDVWTRRMEIYRRELELDESVKLDVLEVGVGTGAISLSLAKEFPEQLNITGLDISPEALSLAQENATLNKIENINWLESDLYTVLAENQKFDFIVSNPPYIAPQVIEDLEPEVRDFDPMLALDGGAEDGLDFIRRMFQESPQYLKDNGEMILEIGYDQAKLLEQSIENNTILNFVEIIKDYGDNDRFAIVKKINAEK